MKQLGGFSGTLVQASEDLRTGASTLTVDREIALRPTLRPVQGCWVGLSAISRSTVSVEAPVLRSSLA